MIDWDDPFNERSELEQATEDLFQQTPEGEEIDEAIEELKHFPTGPPSVDKGSYDLPFLPQYVTRPLWVVTETRKEISVSLKPIW